MTEREWLEAQSPQELLEFIVSMGPVVIPLLLRELQGRTGQWHRALRLISGADPESPAERGNIDKAADRDH